MIKIDERLKMLRKLMKSKNIQAYIVNTSDPHNSEYIAERYKVREWISGFTGSAGTVVITEKEALLWTDGRYFIQAENEIKDSEFQLYKIATPGYPTYTQWLRENLSQGDIIGFDGEIMSQEEFESLEKGVGSKEIEYLYDSDLVGEIWEDRPKKPSTKAFIHELKYTGKSTKEKLDLVREMMEKDEMDYYLISSLDDIAWLYNIRGRDVKNNPVNISYTLISKNSANLYIDKNKIDTNVNKFLKENGVSIFKYEDIIEGIKNIKDDSSLYLDKERTNRWIYGNIDSNINIKSGINYTTTLKGRKNKTEIENQKNAYIKDGVALVKFLYWLENNIDKEKITEISAAKKLKALREKGEDYVEDSFDTISAYGENAAMMHYSATEETDAELNNKGLYLVDSGAQYYDGTTDITRTVALGELTEEEIKDFTLVLKGVIKLSNARFLHGSTGHSLDVLARYHLWQEGIDYKSGTGHGIGFMLNVHEGPHRIATVVNDIILEEGMITSIEPGVYRTKMHGIRIENIVVVQKDIKTDSGQFMKFETLSFVPIDKSAIDKNMLSKEEIQWINSYHKEVYNKLECFLSNDERKWLERETLPI